MAVRHSPTLAPGVCSSESYRNATAISSIKAGDDPGLQCFLDALELIGSGQIDVAPMITHTLGFEEVDKAYDLAFTREDGAGKVLVKMPGYGEYIE